MIPGPIGMISAGVSAAAYAKAGDRKNAIIMAAGIAAAAVGAGSATIAFRAAKIANTAKVAEGAYGLGKAGKITSSIAGKMYVGRGATKVQQGGRTFLQSADGLRRYGEPIAKGNGRAVANFLRKTPDTTWSHYNRKIASGRVSNGHLTIGGLF